VYGGTTDAEGKFRIEGVEPGEYRLMAERQGFVTQQYGAKRQYSAGMAIQVTAGLEVKGLEMRMTPQAVVTGRVLDEEGEPLANAMVQVYQQRYMQGKRQLAPMGGQPSNDVGEFRVANLAPGRYWLSATWRSPMAYARLKEGQPQEQYVTTFYPGTTEAAAARAIEVAAGQELSGIDIRMQKARVYRISGRVTGYEGNMRNLQLMVMPQDRTAALTVVGGMGQVREDGTFETGGVTPGSYFVGVIPMDGRARSIIGRAAVEVGRENVENVTVAVGSAVTVSGSVRVERDAAQAEAAQSAQIDLTRMRIQLFPVEGMAMGIPMGTPKEDGSFQIEGVRPDRYRVQAIGAPPGTWLKSVRVGDQDAMEGGAEVNAGSVVEVVLAPGPGTISGTVQDSKQQPAAGSVLTLIPEPMKTERQDLFRVTTADQNGQFVLTNVPPGDYRLFAWEDLEPGRHLDAEFLKQYESKAQKISVQRNGQHTAALRQIVVEDSAR
jgi:hypothetical protein